ncbi:hypothetical protein HPB47_016775 [Ixodes persulcatus]|uniref:Uncharacterized protein n=1 Tax=Ixodes persulcatus TaxID=34615 RepID=A0AC60QQ02_IXOPE|nr:hypothetical protein HPB47_016775 [Ixodes persulcatus]
MSGATSSSSPAGGTCGFTRSRLDVRGFPVSGEKGILVVESSPGMVEYGLVYFPDERAYDVVKMSCVVSHLDRDACVGSEVQVRWRDKGLFEATLIDVSELDGYLKTAEKLLKHLHCQACGKNLVLQEYEVASDTEKHEAPRHDGLGAGTVCRRPRIMAALSKLPYLIMYILSCFVIFAAGVNERHTTSFAALEVVELQPGSSVYVQQGALWNIETTCKTATATARSLLTAIYTQQALLVCSVKGHKAKGLHRPSEQRPPLHFGGIAAILGVRGPTLSPPPLVVKAPACLRPTGLREALKTTPATGFTNISGNQTLQATNNCRRAHQRRALHPPSALYTHPCDQGKKTHAASQSYCQTVPITTTALETQALLPAEGNGHPKQHDPPGIETILPALYGHLGYPKRPGTPSGLVVQPHLAGLTTPLDSRDGRPSAQNFQRFHEEHPPRREPATQLH